MSHEINPYEPPKAAIHGAATRDANVVIDGSYLRVPRQGAVLASRCVKCNEPGSKELMRELHWHSPWLYIMVVFPGVVIYALVAMIVRKKAAVQVSLCERHVNLRRAGIAIGWGGPVAGIAAMLALPQDIGAVVLLVALLVGPVTGLMMARVVDARRMDDSHAWLNVGSAFLASYQR
jgi:hypothetical protein